MEHYRVEHIADDAWAAIATARGSAVGNAGIVCHDNRTIVFDTSMCVAAAEELRVAAERIAPVAAVINSHWHADHVGGNAVFADVEVITTDRTRELLEERDDSRGDGAVTTIPDSVVVEQLDLGGIVVETLGGGHTDSDAFLWFEDTLFAGDLVVVGGHPWVGDGDLEHWIEILEAFEARSPRTIVPGHGPVGSSADIAPLRRYLEGLLDGTAEPVEGWDSTDGSHRRNLDAVALR